MANKIILRRDSAANWSNVDPVLSNGEIGLETDTGKFKIGNGVSTWEALLYYARADDIAAEYNGALMAAVADAEEQVDLAAAQVTLAAAQVPLAAAQVTQAAARRDETQVFRNEANTFRNQAQTFAAQSAASAAEASAVDDEAMYNVVSNTGSDTRQLLDEYYAPNQGFPQGGESFGFTFAGGANSSGSSLNGWRSAGLGVNNMYPVVQSSANFPWSPDTLVGDGGTPLTEYGGGGGARPAWFERIVLGNTGIDRTHGGFRLSAGSYDIFMGIYHRDWHDPVPGGGEVWAAPTYTAFGWSMDDDLLPAGGPNNVQILERTILTDFSSGVIQPALTVTVPVHSPEQPISVSPWTFAEGRTFDGPWFQFFAYIRKLA